MVEAQAQIKELRYLDQAFFVVEPHLPQIPAHYECCLCTGVVLEPMECSNRECSILLCHGCISDMKEPKCPNNCGSTQFNKPNRIVMQ